MWKSDNHGVKEATYIQTGRRGKDRQPGWRGHAARLRLAHQVVPHSPADKLGETTGDRDRPCNSGSQHQEKKVSKPLAVKSYVAVGQIASLTGESVGGADRVLECTQAHPCGNQHQKGAICLWEAGEVTESRARTQQVALFPP